MANRSLHRGRTFEPETVTIHAKITILGNTTPANGTFTLVEGGKALGAVTRTGTGAYKVLLTDIWPKLLSAQISIAPHSAAARGVKLGAIDVNNLTAASRAAAFIIVNTAEAAVETPNGETDTVYLTLTMKNSTAG